MSESGERQAERQLAPAADEVDDFDLIAVGDHRLRRTPSRLSTTRLCSTATRRASMSSCASSSVTVRGPATSCGSPFRVIFTAISRAVHFTHLAACSASKMRYRSDRLLTVDRAARVALVPHATARARARCSICSPTSAYYSQPIALRHPIVFYEGHLPGVQLQHAGQEGARPAEHRRAARDAVRARHRSARDRGAPSGGREVGSVGERRRGAASGRRATSFTQFADEADRQVLDALANARPRTARPSAARSRRSGVHHPRARGDASGDAALHVASSAVRPEAPAGRLHAACRRRAAAGRMDRRAGRARDARRRRASRSPFGWDNEFPALQRSRCRRSRSSATT